MLVTAFIMELDEEVREPEPEPADISLSPHPAIRQTVRKARTAERELLFTG